MDDTYSVADVGEIVQAEGLGEAVQNFVDADNIEDPDLQHLFKEAKEALDAIESFLDI